MASGHRVGWFFFTIQRERCRYLVKAAAQVTDGLGPRRLSARTRSAFRRKQNPAKMSNRKGDQFLVSFMGKRTRK